MYMCLAILWAIMAAIMGVIVKNGEPFKIGEYAIKASALEPLVILSMIFAGVFLLAYVIVCINRDLNNHR